jgi:hypothetical protein
VDAISLLAGPFHRSVVDDGVPTTIAGGSGDFCGELDVLEEDGVLEEGAMCG